MYLCVIFVNSLSWSSSFVKFFSLSRNKSILKINTVKKLQHIDTIIIVLVIIIIFDSLSAQSL